MSSLEHLKVRAIRCNKTACKTCPHHYYAYAVSGNGANRRHRYLGTCNQLGEPREPYALTLF